MMSTWNRSYLEAIGVPVWVSRQAPMADTISNSVSNPVSNSASEKINLAPEADAELKTETQAEAEAQTQAASTFGFISVAANPQAKAYVLISPEQDLKQAQTNFQLLKQAWKQWQSTEFPLALGQLVEQTDSTASSESIDTLNDKQILVSAAKSFNLQGMTAEPVPSLDWQSADDKKAWWQLLQTFVE